MPTGIGVTEIANAVVEHNFDYWCELIFNNNVLFDFPNTPYSVPGEIYNGPQGILPVKPPVGGVSERFLVHTSSHSAAAFTEYDALPTAGSDAWIFATPDTTSIWTSVLMTGWAKDEARGPEDLIQVLTKNVENAARAVRDVINTTFLGTGASCLQQWVDSTTTCAGVNRTTYSAFGAAETAVSGVLTLESMDDLVETVTSGDRQAPINELEWWFPANQITNYRRLSGVSGARAVVPEMSVVNGGNLDLGYTSYSHQGIPIRMIPDLTTTVVCLIHKPDWYVQEKRSLQLVEKPYSGDGSLFALSWRGDLICQAPQKQGKLTGLTA